MRYAETVGFVAHMLYHPETTALLVDVERQIVAGKVDFLKPLGYA